MLGAILGDIVGSPLSMMPLLEISFDLFFPLCADGRAAGCFGIGADRAVRFENDAQGVAVNYHVVSETVCRMRQAACPASVGADWKEEIEADFQKRHQG